jgi:hypothetical protein
MLAQGFTRNTFISGEGASLTPVDADGRIFYCPPNSAANAHFLSMLRAMLVQDPDLDDDGRPETLRLCFATPKRWLADGQSITVARAPTAFGEVSVKLTSHLAAGEILAEIALPSRASPTRTLLRARVPDGWRITRCFTPTGELPAAPRAPSTSAPCAASSRSASTLHGAPHPRIPDPASDSNVRPPPPFLRRGSPRMAPGYSGTRASAGWRCGGAGPGRRAAAGASIR